MQRASAIVQRSLPITSCVYGMSSSSDEEALPLAQRRLKTGSAEQAQLSTPQRRKPAAASYKEDSGDEDEDEVSSSTDSDDEDNATLASRIKETGASFCTLQLHSFRSVQLAQGPTSVRHRLALCIQELGVHYIAHMDACHLHPQSCPAHLPQATRHQVGQGCSKQHAPWACNLACVL